MSRVFSWLCCFVSVPPLVPHDSLRSDRAEPPLWWLLLGDHLSILFPVLVVSWAIIGRLRVAPTLVQSLLRVPLPAFRCVGCCCPVFGFYLACRSCTSEPRPAAQAVRHPRPLRQRHLLGGLQGRGAGRRAKRPRRLPERERDVFSRFVFWWCRRTACYD